MEPIWKQDFPKPTFEIVSAELPSGSAWLVNCLLELGISIWNPWDVEIEGEWSRQKQHLYKYEEPQGLWQQSLPALQKGRLFDFEASDSGRTSHRWPTTIPTDKKVIFFVRDPRDMLYSHWRRCRHNIEGYSMSFEDFLQSKYHHYPLSYVDYLCLFFKLWQAELAHFDYKIIRFEDYKSNATMTLMKVLNFLGLKRTDKEVVLATLASDFKVVKQIEDDLAGQGKLQRKFNYASQPFEYRGHLTKATEQLFSGAFNPLCQWLGYEPLNLLEPVMHSGIRLTHDWINDMVESIYNGQVDPIRSKSLYQLLIDEFPVSQQEKKP